MTLVVACPVFWCGEPVAVGANVTSVASATSELGSTFTVRFTCPSCNSRLMAFVDADTHLRLSRILVAMQGSDADQRMFDDRCHSIFVRNGLA